MGDRYVRQPYARLRDREALRAAIAEAKLPWKVLAKEAGLSSVGLIGHLLGGRRDACSPEVARAIEEACGVESGDLFEITDAKRTRRPKGPELARTP